jgi:hypothetical protein
MGTSVPLSGGGATRHHRQMVTGVIIHLHNDLPLLVDMDELPAGTDRVVRCTNVRTVDGKRPQFVHDRNSTFIFPLAVIRLIEAPAYSENTALAVAEMAGPIDETAVLPEVVAHDDEPDEDLLARIRQI